ncbi:MAG: hypothetical protein JWM15_434 [Cryptosporangiaceae bacterium]|nr:hypothetical protein [Cryptosporangiaceae bacterium]
MSASEQPGSSAGAPRHGHVPGDHLRDRLGADAAADPADPIEAAAVAVEAGRRRGAEAGRTGSGDVEPTLKEMLASDAFRQDVLSQIGGWRGMAESAVPVLVFIVANMLTGLRPAIWCSVGAALAIAAWRLVRKQSPRQALNGLFGIAIAAFLAARTGRAEAFYLPGILLGLVYAVVFAGSTLVRWPLVGVAWGFLTGAGTGWRRDRRLLRLFTWLTVLWAVVWAARIGVQAGMYLAGASATALGVARLALGYPPLIALLAVTIWVVRRQHLDRPGS